TAVPDNGPAGMPILRSSYSCDLLPEEFSHAGEGVKGVAIAAALLVWFRGQAQRGCEFLIGLRYVLIAASACQPAIKSTRHAASLFQWSFGNERAAQVVELGNLQEVGAI